MSVTVEISSKFAGPNACEILSIAESVPSIKCRYAFSLAERKAVESLLHSSKDVVLVVSTDDEADRVCYQFGLPLAHLSDEHMHEGKAALTSRKNQMWRTFVKEHGKSQSTLIRAVADSIRNGNVPKATASIVSDVINLGINPIDADVLLRLRSRRT